MGGMPRGGQNRLPEEIKRAHGTFEPGAHKPGPRPAALAAWPDPPEKFTAREREAWVELGCGAMTLSAVSAGDLVLATYTARMMARLNALLDDPESKVTDLSSMQRLVVQMLHAFGMSPTTRQGAQPLAKDEGEDETVSPVLEFKGRR